MINNNYGKVSLSLIKIYQLIMDVEIIQLWEQKWLLFVYVGGGWHDTHRTNTLDEQLLCMMTWLQQKQQ